MAKWRCVLCGYVFNEELQGKKFEELPDNWKCPRCGASKSKFVKM
ncbi:MAG: rubredoxin [archaeon]|nr:rubredoxin [archaeon]